MRFRLALSAFFVLALMASATATVSAFKDRTPPTRPTDLRVPNVGRDHVGLAWNASSDNSGSFSYRLYREDLSTPVTLPKTQRAYTWRGLEPGRTYSFYVVAVDGAGNVSPRSNTVSATTNGDLEPPTAPSGLTVTDRNSTTVWLSWQPATDNVAVGKYVVYVDNTLYGNLNFTGPTSAKVFYLAHSTTYSFHVVAEDTSRNVGPPSETVVVTTLPSSDTTPPTAPADLVGFDYGCALFELHWTASSDNADPDSALRFDVYVDGILAPEATVVGLTFTELQVAAGQRTFVVTATDRSNNTSAPSNVFSVLARTC